MFIEEHLKKYSNYNIGGRTPHFFAFKTIDEAIQVATHAQAIGKPIVIVGGGTNILFGDKGFDGVVLKNEIETIEVRGDYIRAGGGVPMKRLLEVSFENGLSGLEWAGGLPGTLGGAIRGNAGAFGGEIKDNIVEVASVKMSRERPAIIHRNNVECEFGYRSSIFKTKHPDEIILEATLIFRHGVREDIKKAIDEKIHYRVTRHPIEFPNIGSIFKNVDFKDFPRELHESVAHVVKNDPFPVVPVAYLIAEAGLKGMRIGGAEVSPKHPNFIVNVGDATANDVKRLIALVKKTIKEKFKVDLEEEIVYIER